MQSTQNVPSDSSIPLSSFHTDTISSSTQLDPSASALQQLQAAIKTANDTKSSLVTQLHTLRQSLHSSFHSISTEHQTQTNAVERAARSLAVRAMELDNRALDLDNRESNFQSTRSQFDARHAQRQRTLDQASRQVSQKETALLAREASLKYSAVEQMRLHAWSRELEKREARLGEAESAEKERIAARVAAVTRRELLAAEKETRLDTVMKQREADVLRREKAVEAVAQTLERQRSEALLQIEAERSQFWAHQQKLSAVVAAETETLLSEQAALRKQFETEALEAKLATRQMLEQVAAMKKLVNEADTTNNNGSTDVDGNDHVLTKKLAGLAVGDDN